MYSKSEEIHNLSRCRFFSTRHPRATLCRAQQTCAASLAAPLQRMFQRERVRIDIASALFSRRSLRRFAMVWKMLSKSRDFFAPGAW